MIRGWAFFHSRENWKRRARKRVLGSIRTATRRIVPAWPVLLALGALAYAVSQIVTVTAVP